MQRVDTSPNDGLRTDLYQLTMAAAYFEAGLDHEATFELFTRRLTHDRGYYVACGLEPALEYLEELRFTDECLAYLASIPAFRTRDHSAFFEHLRGLRFEGEVWAVPEGTPVFPWEPLVRVTGPAIQAQLVETYLLSLINYQTLVATKAARVRQACAGKRFVDFGTRRAHGPEAGEHAARASFVGGARGTSNVEAARRLGVKVYGTFAHSWVMTFPDEDEAFLRYQQSFPGETTYLIDTYDTLAAARRIVAQGLPCQAVRLDSGDLRALSVEVRRIFDEGGRPEIKVVASSDLNEYKIAAMEAEGSAVDVYGVGTEMVTSKDMPALGGVYKLVETRAGGDLRHPVKLAADKKSWPGRKQVYRQEGAHGRDAGDVIALHDEPPPTGRPLLEKVMQGGRRLRPAPALEDVQARCAEQVDRLPEGVRALRAPAEYPVTRSDALLALAERARERARLDLEAHRP